MEICDMKFKANDEVEEDFIMDDEVHSV